MPPSLTIRVPATTANLGPGFDCLGMALNLWNELTVETSRRLTIEVEGEGAGSLPRDETNIIFQAIRRFYVKSGKEPPTLAVRCQNRIPLSRGLGSSAAAIVSGLTAANYLLGRPASRMEILQEAAAIEGHADNVAPAIFGGCRLVFKEDGVYQHREIATLSGPPAAVLFIPDFEMPTSKARSVLPATISRADAVFNLSRVALLVTSLETGRYRDFKWGTQDKFHQPYRQNIFPAMDTVFKAALEAGADGAFLSGSGSTILAMARLNKSGRVGEAMLRAGAREGVKGKIIVTRPVVKGAHLVK